MAENQEGSIVEDADQIGSSEVVADNAEGQQAPAEAAEPDLDIDAVGTQSDQDDEASEAESQDEAEGEADEPPAKGDTEVRLPWNPKQQKADQDRAAFERRLTKAEHVIEEQKSLIEELRQPKPSGEVELDKAVADLEALETPDEFADEDAVKQYREKFQALTGKVKAARQKLAQERVEAAKPKAKPKPVTDPDSTPAVAPNSPPGQTDFNDMCVEQEVEHGIEVGKIARPAIASELRKLGYGEKKWLSKALLGKLVARVYRQIAEKAASREASKKPQAGSTQPRRAEDGTYAPAATEGRVHLPTIRELAEKQKAEQQRGRNKRT